MARVVVCIPAYNEEATIAKVVLKAKRYADAVLVCDDGSTDMTGEIAEALGAIVIRHGRNLGYGAALASLFKNALKLNPEVVVTIDADGQHDPDDIPRLIEPILRGEADVVIGSRFADGSEGRMPRYRVYGIKTITGISGALSGLKVTDAQSGFRAYSGRVLKLLVPVEEGMGASTEILSRASQHNLRVVEVPIAVRYGGARRNPLAHAVEVVMSTIKFASIRHPVLFYGAPGAALVLAGAFFLAWTLKIYATEGRVVTNIALAALGLTLTGMLLLIAAIILYTIVAIVREEMYRLHWSR